MTHRLICGSSIALEIMAYPEEELVILIYTILPTALIIQLNPSYAAFIMSCIV